MTPEYYQKSMEFLLAVRRGIRIPPSTAFSKISPEQRKRQIKANRRIAGLVVLRLVRDPVA